MSGEGIPFALETAGVAAGTIRGAFAAGRFDSTWLSRYERRWRAKYDADLGVSDLVVSMLRNRDLAKLWLNVLRMVGFTARDREYALWLGGLVGGLTPVREGIPPAVALGLMTRAPELWLRVLQADPAANLLNHGVSLLRWQAEIASSVAADFPRWSNWALDVGAKYFNVLGRLGARARSSDL
jgi:hypothetical protein